jgi:response regulator RpfG family c-di-GMP phosphodiesterase
VILGPLEENLLAVWDGQIMANILVVGGFLTTALLFQEVLQDKGHCVFLAMNGEEGLDSAQLERIDVVIVDGNLIDCELSDFLRRLKLIHPHALAVFSVWDSHSLSVDNHLWDGFHLKTNNYKSLQTVIQGL